MGIRRSREKRHLNGVRRSSMPHSLSVNTYCKEPIPSGELSQTARGFSVMLNLDAVAEADRIFNALAEQGQCKYHSRSPIGRHVSVCLLTNSIYLRRSIARSPPDALPIAICNCRKIAISPIDRQAADLSPPQAAARRRNNSEKRLRPPRTLLAPHSPHDGRGRLDPTNPLRLP
jgi:hypothetical protein